MKKKYDYRKIRRKDSYSGSELSHVYNVHIQTIRAWNKRGLPTIPGTYPPLYLGSDIRKFLQKERSKRRTKLEPNEMYCMACKKGVKSIISNVIKSNVFIGHGKETLRLEGKCPNCGNITNRITTDLSFKNSAIDRFTKKKKMKFGVTESKQIKFFSE